MSSSTRNEQRWGRPSLIEVFVRGEKTDRSDGTAVVLGGTVRQHRAQRQGMLVQVDLGQGWRARNSLNRPDSPTKVFHWCHRGARTPQDARRDQPIRGLLESFDPLRCGATTGRPEGILT